MTRRVLSVASECVPLLKTGGLADVVGALPKALAGQGWQMRVLMPAYPGLIEKLGKAPDILWTDADLFGGTANVLAGSVDGLDMLLLNAPHLYRSRWRPLCRAAGRLLGQCRAFRGAVLGRGGDLRQGAERRLAARDLARA